MKQQLRRDMNPFDGVVPDYSSVLADHYSMGAKYHIRREYGRNDYLLMLTLKGAGIINLNGRDIITEPGVFTVHHPNVYQDYRTRYQRKRWDFLWIHCLPPPPIATLLNFPDTSDGLSVLDLKQLPSIERRRVTALFNDAVLWSLKANPLDRQMAMNLLENLLLRIHNSLSNEQSPFMEAIHTYILKHLREELSAEQLAATMNLSPSRFSHRFKEESGTSPQVYVEGIRMECARRMLESGGISVKETADAIGFADQNYFANRYRKAFGHPPSKARQI